MHNSYESLEKKCKKYFFKQKMKIVSPLIALFIIVISIGFMLTKQEDKTTVIPTPIPAEKPVIVKKTKVKDEVKPIVEEKEIVKGLMIKQQKKTVKDVAYSMKIDNSYVDLSKIKTPTKKIKPKNKTKKTTKKVLKKEVKQPKPQKTLEREPKVIKMSVKSLSTTEDMEAIYKKEKKYSLALKIGQKYYEQHKYSKSLFWSKEANLLDHKAEGAWILYAKSEYAKGHKKRAIKILNLYRGNTKSQEADSLVMEWMERMK